MPASCSRHGRERDPPAAPLVMSDAEARVVAERLSPLGRVSSRSASPPLVVNGKSGDESRHCGTSCGSATSRARARVPLRAHQGHQGQIKALPALLPLEDRTLA